ncbi:MAG: glycosyltransferase family 2 protein, partial [Anaerolineales bacterium]|nr:glycosyltransferase family 2 protein [Anaerolineales bacterium]
MVDPQNPDYQNTPVSPSRPQYGYRPADPSAAPAVSIVTPFYNTGEVFRETAQSVLQQSLQQWEWLIVNDGSHEPVSLHILDEYRQSDPRVRVIDHPENRGLPAARNTGYRAARSDYILYLDSDDLLEPTAAEKWLWFLESYPRYAFAGGYSTGFGALEYLWQSGFQDMAANLEKNRINHVVMIRKAVLEAVGGYDESLREGLEDWDFWIRCAAQGYWGKSVREYLHWYRTSQAPVERWKDMQEERLERIRAGLRQRYPNLWEGGFPRFEPYVDLQWVQMNEAPPCANRLAKEKPRLLILAPWLVVGGAEKFNLEV